MCIQFTSITAVKVVFFLIDMSWSPRQSHLAICTGGGHIYFWTPFGCLSVAVASAPGLQASYLR